MKIQIKPSLKVNNDLEYLYNGKVYSNEQVRGVYEFIYNRVYSLNLESNVLMDENWLLNFNIYYSREDVDRDLTVTLYKEDGTYQTFTHTLPAKSRNISISLENIGSTAVKLGINDDYTNLGLSKVYVGQIEFIKKDWLTLDLLDRKIPKIPIKNNIYDDLNSIRVNIAQNLKIKLSKELLQNDFIVLPDSNYLFTLLSNSYGSIIDDNGYIIFDGVLDLDKIIEDKENFFINFSILDKIGGFLTELQNNKLWFYDNLLKLNVDENINKTTEELIEEGDLWLGFINKDNFSDNKFRHVMSPNKCYLDVEYTVNDLDDNNHYWYKTLGEIKSENVVFTEGHDFYKKSLTPFYFGRQIFEHIHKKYNIDYDISDLENDMVFNTLSINPTIEKIKEPYRPSSSPSTDVFFQSLGYGNNDIIFFNHFFDSAPQSNYNDGYRQESVGYTNDGYGNLKNWRTIGYTGLTDTKYYGNGLWGKGYPNLTYLNSGYKCESEMDIIEADISVSWAETYIDTGTMTRIDFQDIITDTIVNLDSDTNTLHYSNNPFSFMVGVNGYKDSINNTYDYKYRNYKYFKVNFVLNKGDYWLCKRSINIEKSDNNDSDYYFESRAKVGRWFKIWRLNEEFIYSFGEMTELEFYKNFLKALGVSPILNGNKIIYKKNKNLVNGDYIDLTNKKIGDITFNYNINERHSSINFIDGNENKQRNRTVFDGYKEIDNKLNINTPYFNYDGKQVINFFHPYTINHHPVYGDVNTNNYLNMIIDKYESPLPKLRDNEFRYCVGYHTYNAQEVYGSGEVIYSYPSQIYEQNLLDDINIEPYNHYELDSIFAFRDNGVIDYSSAYLNVKLPTYTNDSNDLIPYTRNLIFKKQPNFKKIIGKFTMNDDFENLSNHQLDNFVVASPELTYNNNLLPNYSRFYTDLVKIGNDEYRRNIKNLYSLNVKDEKIMSTQYLELGINNNALINKYPSLSKDFSDNFFDMKYNFSNTNLTRMEGYFYLDYLDLKTLLTNQTFKFENSYYELLSVDDINSEKIKIKGILKKNLPIGFYNLTDYNSGPVFFSDCGRSGDIYNNTPGNQIKFGVGVSSIKVGFYVEDLVKDVQYKFKIKATRGNYSSNMQLKTIWSDGDFTYPVTVNENVPTNFSFEWRFIRKENPTDKLINKNLVLMEFTRDDDTTEETLNINNFTLYRFYINQ